MKPTDLKNHFFIPLLLCLGLNFSGVLSFVTALPLIFIFMTSGRKYFGLASLINILFVLGLNALAATALQPLYSQFPALNWVLPITQTDSTLQTILAGALPFVLHVLIAALVGFVLSPAPELDSRAASKRAFRFSSLGVILIFGLTALTLLPFLLPRVDHIYLEYREQTGALLEQMIASQEKSGADMNDIISLRSRLDEIITYFFYLFPAFVFTSVAGLYVFNLSLAKRFFAPRFKQLHKILLTRYQIRFEMVWVVIAMLALALINLKGIHSESLKYLLLNLLVVMATAYFFQGIAILVETLERYQVNGLMRLLLYFSIFTFMQLSTILLIGVGFFDSWIDLRRLNNTPKKPASAT